MEDYKEYVRDLGFKLVRRLNPSGCYVYEASRGDLLVTLKFGGIESFFSQWAYDHVTTENRVLDRVRGVDGIAEKISFHKLGWYHKLVVLVKKYIEEGDCRLTDQAVLINAVNALHENGMVRLDLYCPNIIIDPSGKPYLIDLGFCLFKEELSKKDFAYEKRKDLRCLEWILSMVERKNAFLIS